MSRMLPPILALTLLQLEQTICIIVLIILCVRDRIRWAYPNSETSDRLRLKEDASADIEILL